MADKVTDRGRTRITSRALTGVAAAVAAESLGVRAHQIGVALAESDAGLLLTVTAPRHVEPVSNSAGEQIRHDVSSLIGSEITRVQIKAGLPVGGGILTGLRARYRDNPFLAVGMGVAGLAAVGATIGVIAGSITRGARN